MTYTFTIQGRLAGLNEIIDENRKGYHAGARQKKDEQFLIKLQARHLPAMKEPVSIHYTWYEPNRKRDWDNIMAGQKFIQDALVESHKLKNDGWNNICGISHDFTVDAENPRVVVTITDSEIED